MKKNRFLYSLSAIALACIISFSGLGNTYIQAEATSVGIEKGVWNDDASVWDNIKQYLLAFTSASGLFYNPLATYLSAQSFYDFMISDGVSHDNAHGVFCDCDVVSHTSFDGNEHGGGGFVRDGISTDSIGNVSLSDEVCDLFHGFITNYLNETYGYYIVPTLRISDLDDATLYSNLSLYNSCLAILNTFLTDNNIFFWNQLQNRDGRNLLYGYITDIDDKYFLLAEGNTKYNDGTFNSDSFSKYDGYYQMAISLYDSNWSIIRDYMNFYYEDGTFDIRTTSIYGNGYSNLIAYSADTLTTQLVKLKAPVTIDGRTIKVFKSLDTIKMYSVNQQPYYVADSFNTYDSSIDNSTTITNQEFTYYNDNSSTIFQTIQNNINNYGGELDEKTVQDIVNSAVQDIKDSIANSGNDDNDNGGSNNGGNGIGDLVGGVGDLLDTILSLIGKVMSVVADFTQSILDLFSGFTDFTDGFSNFLSGAFSFIPQEIWNVIQVGLSLMILLAVIKFLRK